MIRGKSIVRRVGVASLCVVMTGLVAVVAPSPLVAGAAVQVISTARASLATGGGQLSTPAGTQNTGTPAISDNGRYIGFFSNNSDVVAGDTNARSDVFVHDSATDTTSRVSLSSSGAQGSSFSSNPALSNDGRHVAFRSGSSDLVSGDANSAFDVFVRDRDTDADGIYDEAGAVRTQIVSRAATPGSFANMATGNGNSGVQGDPPLDISANGRFVAFDSDATDLVPGDTNALRDIFVRDRDTDNDGVFDEPGAERTTRMSVSAAGGEATGGRAGAPRISATGRYVAFISLATNLDPGDTNGRADAFVHDRDTDNDGIFDEPGSIATFVVSNSSAGTAADDDTLEYGFDMSPNGRFISFQSEAANFVDGDTANSLTVFLHDRDSDADGVFDEPAATTTTAVDVRTNGVLDNSGSSTTGVSDDGTVVFSSGTADLVLGDTNAQSDVFIRPLAGPIVRASVSSANAEGSTNDNNPGGNTNFGVAIAGNTRKVAYTSGFENLVSGDTNNSTDIFLTEISDRPTSVTAALSANTATTGPGATSVPINAIPTERIKSLGLDVATSPTGAKYRPTAPKYRPTGAKYRPTGAKYRPTGAKYRPTGAKFRPTGAKFRPVAETTLDVFSDVLATIPEARTTPIAQLPIDLDMHPGGWAALLVGTPLQGRPTQSVSIGQVMDLLVGAALPPSHPLRTVLVGEIQTDESPLDGASPAAFMLGKTPLSSLAFSPTETWCDRLSSETSGANTCAGLGVGPTTTMLGLDLNPTASAVLDHFPILRRLPLAQNLAVLNANAAPIMSARLEDLGLSVTRIGDISLPAAVSAVPAIGAIPLDPLAAPIRDAVAVCTTLSFDCTGKTLGQAATTGALVPTANLATLGPNFGSVTVGSLTASLLTGIEVNDVITGYLERSDFPWEDLDLVTAGVQEFASSGLTVDYTLAIRANGGSASYDATAVVSLPAGFRLKPGTAAITGGPGVSIDAAVTSYTETATTVTWAAHGVLPDTDYSLVFTALPGFKLGTFSAGAKVTVAEVVGTSAAVPITLVQNADPGGTPATAQTITGNTLYFQYIGDGADVDLYNFAPSAGAQVGVRLSHLAGDGDLVLYGPPTDAAGTGPSAKASRAIPIAGEPTDDGGMSRNPKASSSGNDLGADVPRLDGQTVVGHSAASGITDMEETSAAAANLVQVSAYQGATSTLPYLLRVREFIPDPLPACPAYTRTGGTAGTLPSLAGLPANLDTLILVNQQRLGDTFGAASGPLLSKLGQLAGAPGVVGAVLPVEGSNSSLAAYPDVAGAYSAWNADPCDPSLANGVVDQIGALVEGIRGGTLPGVAAHPQLKNIVLVGADDIVPMARLADTTRAGNEMQYAESFDVTSEYYGALASSHFLSDDPYGDRDPVSWMDRRLYVPDYALGRLVETPAEITTMVDQYLASNGHLDTSRAFVSGYDFMIPGANKLTSILGTKLAQAGGAAPAITTRINNDWTAADVLSDFTAHPPSVGVLSSHASHTGAMSAAGSVLDSTDDLSAADLAATLPIGSRLLISLGCHAGLNASDAVTLGGPAAPDWAQELSARGAVYIGESGFSLGDDSGSQLHDLLIQDYAGQLDGAVTVGDALMLAKQKYFSTKGLYGAYDDKVISSTIMYGIPMFKVGSGTTVRPPATNRITTAGPGSLSQSSFSVHPTFTERTSADGKWYEIGDDAPLAIPGRPIEPRTDLDVTAVGAPGQLNPAHGAVVSALTTDSIQTNFDAAWSRATVDLAANEPELVSADLAFPERLVALTSATDPEGLAFGSGPPLRQTLVVVPGRFETAGADDTQGIGTQQLFGHVGGTTYYSASSDYIEPRISRVTATVTGTTAAFSVQPTDASEIVRAVVLHEDSIGWHTTELTASGATWSGSSAVPSGTTDVPYFVQVVDGAGNVGVSSNKGAMFDAAVRPTISVSDTSVAEPLTGTATATFTVSLSQAPTLPVTVDYTTQDDTARAPADYTSKSGTVSFAAGQISATVAVTVLADDIPETTEQYTLELSGATNATILDGSGRGRITGATDTAPDAPNAPVVKLGPVAGQARVSWSAPADDGGSVITGYRVLRGTTSGTLTEIGTTNAATTALVDTAASAGTSRYFYAVEAQNSVGDSPNSGETTFAPVTVSISDASVFEPEVVTPGVTGRVRIMLSQPAPTDTKVTYYTVSGSATGAVTGGDFKTKGTVVKPLTATIRAGKVLAAATVLIRTDAAVESDETLQVHLANVTLGTPVIGDADGEITIRDSDSIAGPDPVLVVTDARILEGGFGAPRTVQIQAQLNRPLASDLQLLWQTADGTATQPADYKRKLPTKVFIRAGKLFTVFTVTLYPDVVAEGDQQLTLPVSVFAGGPVTVVDGTGTITLADDD